MICAIQSRKSWVVCRVSRRLSLSPSKVVRRGRGLRYFAGKGFSFGEVEPSLDDDLRRPILVGLGGESGFLLIVCIFGTCFVLGFEIIGCC